MYGSTCLYNFIPTHQLPIESDSEVLLLQELLSFLHQLGIQDAAAVFPRPAIRAFPVS